jgi:hypothetical protein
MLTIKIRNQTLAKKYLIVVGARRAVPLQGLIV